jgi:hypothetical protein
MEFFYQKTCGVGGQQSIVLLTQSKWQGEVDASPCHVSFLFVPLAGQKRFANHTTNV